MNKRIQQLALQATKHYPATETSGEFEIFDRQKFAELIVRECVNEATQWYDERGLYGFDVFAKHLQKHFGVEE